MADRGQLERWAREHERAMLKRGGGRGPGETEPNPRDTIGFEAANGVVARITPNRRTDRLRPSSYGATVRGRERGARTP